MSVFNLDDKLLDGAVSIQNHPTVTTLPKQCKSTVSLGGFYINVKIWRSKHMSKLQKILKDGLLEGVNPLNLAMILRYLKAISWWRFLLLCGCFLVFVFLKYNPFI